MARLDLKRKLSKVCWAKPNNRKIILLYHSVGNTPWATPLTHFREQLNWLADHCQLMSLTELLHSKSSNELQVAITFDDGYVSLYEQAAEWVSAKNIKPMVYINTGWITETTSERKASDATIGHYPNEAFMTWTEIKALHTAGWEVGSHGVNHYNFAQMDAEQAASELAQSKVEIETQLNTTCPHFAYPWGRYTNQLKSWVRSQGYLYAAAARHGALKANSDHLALPRINIAQDYSLNDFINIMKGKWDYLSWIQKLKGM